MSVIIKFNCSVCIDCNYWFFLKKWKLTCPNINRKFSYPLHSLFPLVHIFTSRTPLATYTGSNHPHSLCIHFVRRKFHSDSFLPRPSTLISPILCLRSTVICSTCPHNRHLLPPLTSTRQTYSALHWVPLGLYNEWKFSKKKYSHLLKNHRPTNKPLGLLFAIRFHKNHQFKVKFEKP